MMTTIATSAETAAQLGAALPRWSAVPFAGLLVSIALVPLLAPWAWHRHHGKIALFWALLFGVPFLVAYRGTAVHAVADTLLGEYVPFVALLFGLFTIAGGIVVRGDLRGSPVVNVALLAIGTLLASWIGTTGASMLLIRPLLRANADRRHRVHTVVFFIFLVSNIGGVLTPLGDPPLFLGFLEGVPFFWTTRLVRELLVCCAILFPLYAAIDCALWRRERPRVRAAAMRARARISIAGSRGALLLLGVVGAVLLSGLWKLGTVEAFGVRLGIVDLVRDGLIVLLGIVSLYMTPAALRRENGFSWAPVTEVAALFAAIFVTMIPAIAMLRAGASGPMGGVVRAVTTPAQYFWVSGLLSSVLDNAPTYLTFFGTALGSFYPGADAAAGLHGLLHDHARFLEAISAGTVFMGANTYIGNAPNFMVKSIAEDAGVPMPSFFGYVLRWSLPILVPTFVIVMFFL